MVLTEKQRLRFWSRVDTSGGPNACWPWLGYRDPQGYGSMSLRKKTTRVGQIVLMLDGRHAGGAWALHHCDNPPCCNPAHIYAGDVNDNTRDRTVRGRGADIRGNRNPMAKPESRAKLMADGNPMTRPEQRRAVTGSGNRMAKLTEDDVRRVRAAVASGERRQEVAARFGVTLGCVADIVTRRNWKHVE